MTSEFDGLRPTRPAADLRERVLAAAVEAAGEPPHWIDVMWESRVLRLALALALLAALAGNLRARAPSGSVRATPRIVEVDGIPILAERFEPQQHESLEDLR